MSSNAKVSITANQSEWVHADDAAAALKIKKGTLRTLIFRGKIPLSAVRKGANSKFYHLPTLKGLN